MVDPVLVAKAAATLLSNEKTRKGIGWAIAAILSPVIVVLALLCSLGSGAVSHNISAAQLCFQDGPLPDDTPAEYRICIEAMRAHFAELDQSIAAIESNMEDGGSLDPIQVNTGRIVSALDIDLDRGEFSRRELEGNPEVRFLCWIKAGGQVRPRLNHTAPQRGAVQGLPGFRTAPSAGITLGLLG